MVVFRGWDEEGYLLAHKDVKHEIDKGLLGVTSGLDHYFKWGATEGRPIRLGTYTPPQ